MKALVAEEEKGLVLAVVQMGDDHRATDVGVGLHEEHGETLGAPRICVGRTLQIEITSMLHVACATEEGPHRMQFVGAGFLHDTDNTARRVPVFSGGDSGEHVNFGNRILHGLDGPGATLLVVAVHTVFKNPDGPVALTRQVV